MAALSRIEDFRSEFQEHGFALARGVYDAAWVSGLERAFDRIVERLLASKEDVDARWGGASTDALAGASDTVLHTHQVQQYSETWLRALLHEPFLDHAAALLGPDVVLHHSKLFLKPPRTGAPFPLHQDWSYFPMRLDSMIAAVIHVSPATDAMGALRLVPGSHRLGRAEGTSGQGPAGALAGSRFEDAVPCEAAPGDVLFFHYTTLHGSPPNRSDEARKTVLAQLFAGDDEEEVPGSHPNANLALRGFHHRMTRQRANR